MNQRSQQGNSAVAPRATPTATCKYKALSDAIQFRNSSTTHEVKINMPKTFDGTRCKVFRICGERSYVSGERRAKSVEQEPVSGKWEFLGAAQGLRSPKTAHLTVIFLNTYREISPLMKIL